MIRWIFINFLLLFSTFCFGQTTYISIPKIIWENKDLVDASNIVRFNLEKTCIDNPIISIVERDFHATLELERELQKSESYIDGTYIKQGAAKGAQLVIQGYLDTKNLNIKIVDVETNELILSEKIKIKSFLDSRQKVKRPAYFGRFIKDKFLEIISILKLDNIVYFDVIEISKQKKNKAKEILIYNPSDGILKENKELIVFYEKQIGDYEISKNIPIGKVIIFDIENKQLAIAKIEEGSQEILEYFNKKLKLKCKYEKN